MKTTTLKPACPACAFYQRSETGPRFGKCTRVAVHGSKLLLGAEQVRADEARCGTSGKWFQENAQ
jgi:hypothetical protein